MEATKETVSLFNAKAAGKTVKTSMGSIEFDQRGCAIFDASEADMCKLLALGWLGEPEAITGTPEEEKAGTVREGTLLICHASRNKTVKTSMGPITFDAQGMASFNATKDDLIKLSALGWLPQPQPTTENAELVKDGKAPKGPTLEEFVAAGYLPEEYDNFCTNGNYEIIKDAAYQKYKATGKGSWDERLIEDKRKMYAKRDKEAADLREADKKAAKAKADIAAFQTLHIAETPAPTSVAAAAVPAKKSK